MDEDNLYKVKNILIQISERSKQLNLKECDSLFQIQKALDQHFRKVYLVSNIFDNGIEDTELSLLALKSLHTNLDIKEKKIYEEKLRDYGLTHNCIQTITNPISSKRIEQAGLILVERLNEKYEESDSYVIATDFNCGDLNHYLGLHNFMLRSLEKSYEIKIRGGKKQSEIDELNNYISKRLNSMLSKEIIETLKDDLSIMELFVNLNKNSIQDNLNMRYI